MAYRLHRQINIQIGPIEMTGGWQFDIQDFAYRSIAKPRELGEGQKQLFRLQQ